MPTPLASRFAPTPRLLALAALSFWAHAAHAQLPPPALKAPAAPIAKAPAPTRHSQKGAPSLPPPALPAPRDETPQAASHAAPEAVTPEVAPATAPAEAPAEAADDDVIVVPQDAPEFPIAPRAKPASRAKPMAKTIARVGGVDVSSGTEALALAKLRSLHGNRLAQPVVLRLGAREMWTSRAELGASLPLPILLRAARLRARPGKPSDVALRYEVDNAVAIGCLQKLAPSLRREPQAIGDGTTGRAGEELSVGGSLARIKAAIESGGTSVVLLSSTIPFVPKPQSAMPASGNAKFPVVLAEYSTRYNARLEDRSENLRLAAREIDGTVVEPNGVFSANAAIGPRSTDRGFRAAHIFMGKKVIEGVGGGICQSATTVYNAALGAKLTIVERHSHSLPVSYATPANDATIYWGQLDMKFRNNTGAPILVRTFLKGGRFHAQILGARPASAASVVATMRS